MKKKKESSKLSLDKETLKRLSEEQLSPEESEQVGGGATGFTAGKTCCCETAATTSYGSCA